MERLIGSFFSAPMWLALMFLFIAGGAISIDRGGPLTGKFFGVLLTTIDKMTSDDQPPLPEVRREPQGQSQGE